MVNWPLHGSTTKKTKEEIMKKSLPVLAGTGFILRLILTRTLFAADTDHRVTVV
jgi:hypothetical protein